MSQWRHFIPMCLSLRNPWVMSKFGEKGELMSYFDLTNKYKV